MIPTLLIKVKEEKVHIGYIEDTPLAEDELITKDDNDSCITNMVYISDMSDFTIEQGEKLDKMPMEDLNMQYIPKVLLAGDIHAYEDISKLNTTKWKEQKSLTKNDFLISLGDFGLPWSCSMQEDCTEHKVWTDVVMTKNDRYWLDWLVNKNFTTLVVLGNHEGVYSILKYIPKTYYEPIKGYVKELKLEKGSVYFLLRDSEYWINGKRFLVIGGADSIDKIYRTPKSTWWEEELLTIGEEDNILGIIEKNNKFDYVLSHTCPSWLVTEFLYNPMKVYDPVSQFLNHVENSIEFTEWHFGHFHRDSTFTDTLGNHFQCHYNGKPHELNMLGQ